MANGFQEGAPTPQPCPSCGRGPSQPIYWGPTWYNIGSDYIQCTVTSTSGLVPNPQ